MRIVLPELGDKVSTAQALRLCIEFKLEYLRIRIEANPEEYKEWTFDGCSGIPDQLLKIFTNKNWQDITYDCCLPHDLCYGYGELGNKAERKQVDLQFRQDLINKGGMKKTVAFAFYTAVRLGGYAKLSLPFSWGFAKKVKS
ncbi:MAG: hypothetical protein H8E26_11355 [FCB group bacterium]|nr:hypothetical protein [FCB group bacterium]MBL7029217.1 hypothetical protein [Candidatus Neomarinimicrobiota bacterium]MBL7121131.1 hypothetical protein [Candidatus Neomarinimicrobiota bacterium]